MLDSFRITRWFLRIAAQDRDLYLFQVYHTTLYPLSQNPISFDFGSICLAMLDNRHLASISHSTANITEGRIKHRLTLHQATALATVIHQSQVRLASRARILILRLTDTEK